MLGLHEDGSFMNIKEKMNKLRISLVEGRIVRLLRDIINRVEDKEEWFLFEMDRAVLCVLYLYKIVDEKLALMDFF